MAKPTPHDWAKSAPELRHLANGDKLIKTANYGDYHPLPCPYDSDFSYMNVNGWRVAIDPDKKTRVIGRGAFGIVKHAYTSSGEPCALKIEDASEAEMSEYAILKDLDILLAQTTRVRKPLLKSKLRKGPKAKHYALMKDLGTNLKTHLKTHTLTDEERLKLAIDITLAVRGLHTGTKSKSKKKYAHCDLKPSNITINEEGLVSLIDFGLTLENPGSTCPDYRGTSLYLSSAPIRKVIRKLDMTALKRTLFVPPSFKRFSFSDLRTKPTTRYQNRNNMVSVLTAKLVREKNLLTYLDTSSSSFYRAKSSVSINKLAAILILAYCGLEDNYTLLERKAFGSKLIEKLIHSYLSSPPETLMTHIQQLVREVKTPTPSPKREQPHFFKAKKRTKKKPSLSSKEKPQQTIELPENLQLFCQSNTTYQHMLTLAADSMSTTAALLSFLITMHSLQSKPKYKPLYMQILKKLDSTFQEKPSESELKDLKQSVRRLLLYTPFTRYTKTRAAWQKLTREINSRLNKLCNLYIQKGSLHNEAPFNRYDVLPPIKG